MGELIELSKYRPQHPSDDAVDRSITEEILEQSDRSPWITDYVQRKDQEEAGQDMFYVCVNRPRIEQVFMLIEEITAVLPKRSEPVHAEAAAPTENQPVADLSLSEIVDELSFSTHVHWLRLPDHYAGLVIEFRRRIDRYNRLCATLGASL